LWPLQWECFAFIWIIVTERQRLLRNGFLCNRFLRNRAGEFTCGVMGVC
jgi:hypothetical protein